MSNTASIDVTVTAYRASVLSSPAGAPASAFCTINPPTLSIGANGQPEDASNQVGIDPADNRMIWVQRKNEARASLALQFNIISPAGASLTPIRMVFTQTQGSDDADGSLNFPATKHLRERASITVVDDYRSKGKRADNSIPRWKYFIQVADSVSNTTGWIDPGIENSDEN